MRKKEEKSSTKVLKHLRSKEELREHFNEALPPPILLSLENTFRRLHAREGADIGCLLKEGVADFQVYECLFDLDMSEDLKQKAHIAYDECYPKDDEFIAVMVIERPTRGHLVATACFKKNGIN